LLRARRADNDDVNGGRIAAGILADIVLVFHAAYVAFVVLGLAATVVGWALQWRWVRNMWFRALHLAAIALVLVESLMGVSCPLTVFESWLRLQAGGHGYSAGFIAYWMHRLIFYDWPPWMFLSLYAGFTAVVAAMYWLVPPERRKPRDGDAHARGSHAGGARLP
jgi:hypothetical protein